MVWSEKPSLYTRFKFAPPPLERNHDYADGPAPDREDVLSNRIALVRMTSVFAKWNRILESFLTIKRVAVESELTTALALSFPERRPTAWKHE